MHLDTYQDECEIIVNQILILLFILLLLIIRYNETLNIVKGKLAQIEKNLR